MGGTRDARRAESAQRILEAAQQEFASNGFDGATIRAIAQRAGVHASLVMQHYGSKASLFAIAAQLPEADRDSAAEHLLDVLDVRLKELAPESRALVRSMLTVPQVQTFMHDFLDERVENLANSLDGDDAELRAALIVSTILGLTIARHFLALTAFDDVPHEKLVDAANAWIAAISEAPAHADSRTTSV